MILVLWCLNDRYKIWDKAVQCLAVLDSLISLAAFRYTTNFAPVYDYFIWPLLRPCLINLTAFPSMQFTSQENKAMSARVLLSSNFAFLALVHTWTWTVQSERENIVLVVCFHVQTRIVEEMIMSQRVNGIITLILILPFFLVLKEMVQCADQKSSFLIKHLMEIFR